MAEKENKENEKNLNHNTSGKKIEIEMKFPFPEYGEDVLLEKLKCMGGDDRGEYFENNIIFDTSDNYMDKNDHLLRLRNINNKSLLTFKGDRVMDSDFKIRKEIECEVSDFFSMIKILKNLGYKPNRIYQKYRRTIYIDGTFFTIDKLPYGKYIEIEGDKNKIKNIANRLGLVKSEISNMSYNSSLYYYEAKRQNFEISPYIVFENYDVSEIIGTD